MLPPPLPLAPSVEPLALQQVDETQGQVSFGVVRVGGQQLAGSAQGLRPQAGLSQGVDPRQLELGQGARQGLGLVQKAQCRLKMPL